MNLPVRDPSVFASFYFDLGQQVKIEKRVVNSLPELFGEVGGLRDFMKEIAVVLIGGF